MPRAVVGDELGPLENYSIRELDPGLPKTGEVRIAIRAAGVSFVDVLNAKGQYQGRAPVPFTPGSEFAGVVEAVGAGVEKFSVGQRVVATSWGGAYAEAAVVSAEVVEPIPDNISFEEAAVFKVSALTSWHALVDRAQLKPGETLLVLGAGGATGYAAVQIGKYLGANVIASATSDKKRQIALEAGADKTVDARSETWREDVKTANDGQPVDVVFDPVGGESTEPAFRSLGYGGRHLVIGFPRGIATIPTNLPLLKSASLVGVNVQQQSWAEPERAVRNVKAIFDLAAKGLLIPRIAKTYPLEQFRDAMDAAFKGDSAGRIVLVMQ